MKFINRLSNIRVILMVLLLLFVGYLIVNSQINNQKSDYGNIEESDLPNSYMGQRLDFTQDQLGDLYLKLAYNSDVWQISYKDLNVRVIRKEDNTSSTNTVTNVINSIKTLYGQNESYNITYNKKVLDEKIKLIKQQIDISKKNAYIVKKGDKIKLVPHSIGKKLNEEQSKKAIDDSIKNMSTNAVSLIVEDDMPEVISEDLDNITEQISSFSTSFDSNVSERFHNLKLASSRLNGTLLKPNEIFSMDKALKQRTINNGYKTAKAYFDGEVVDEIGGGVCQITTTMYDAVLLANFEIVERKQHTMRVGYAQPGYDAALSDSGIDFKFKNSSKHSIYIYSDINGNTLNIEILGKDDNRNNKIELESQINQVFPAGPDVIIFDNEFPNGQRKIIEKSKDGCSSTLYKKTIVDGKLISTQIVSQDKYKALRGKVIVGKKK